MICCKKNGKSEYYLTVKEAAIYRQVTSVTIRNWIARGLSFKVCSIPSLHCGPKIMISKVELDGFQLNKKTCGRPLIMTKDEIKIAKRLRRDGKTFAEIALLLKKKTMTIWNTLHRGGCKN